jgi:hypothetical protein
VENVLTGLTTDRDIGRCCSNFVGCSYVDWMHLPACDLHTKAGMMYSECHKSYGMADM